MPAEAADAFTTMTPERIEEHKISGGILVHRFCGDFTNSRRQMYRILVRVSKEHMVGSTLGSGEVSMLGGLLMLGVVEGGGATLGVLEGGADPLEALASGFPPPSCTCPSFS